MRTYGLLDVALAGFYAWAGFHLVPNRSPTYNLLLALMVALLAVSGVSLLLRVRWARAVGIFASLALLAFAAAIVVGLVISSAYLRGVYGPLGQGLAVTALVLVALVLELFALVPLFQLRFLLRKE